jgi:hypothetical protein
MDIFTLIVFQIVMLMCNHKMMIHDTTQHDFVKVNLTGVLRIFNFLLTEGVIYAFKRYDFG